MELGFLLTHLLILVGNGHVWVPNLFRAYGDANSRLYGKGERKSLESKLLQVCSRLGGRGTAYFIYQLYKVEIGRNRDDVMQGNLPSKYNTLNYFCRALDNKG